MMNLNVCNNTQYLKGQKKGHYESFFLRANHPESPLAFWIRYTIFSPLNHPEKAIGELWAIFFDGIRNKHIAVKSEVPIADCFFSNSSFEIKIGESFLEDKKLKGKANSLTNSIAWDLCFSGNEMPLFLLPNNFYKRSFPKAKALVGLPLASFSGSVVVNDEIIEINNWIGSQNHNWGSQHTDRYAWGQVAGFDNNADSFLEIATAQVKLGLVYTPKMTIAILRHGGKEYFFNTLLKSIKNKATYKYFEWVFELSNGKEQLKGKIFASKESFLGLNYYNPPGGDKTCLNSKISAANITLILEDGKSIHLNTKHRAAFEILTNDKSHGISLS